MAVKRGLLLLLGIVGSLLIAAVLYISAKGIVVQSYVNQTTPSEPLPTSREEFLPDEIRLPMWVAGTSVLVERLCAYDGPFVEDGSDAEVVNIAALLIKNIGSYELQKAEITLQFGSETMVFYGEHIPAGATVALLEKNATPYSAGDFSACTGWQEVSNPSGIGRDIAITENADNSISVTNLSDSTLEQLTLYYKSWLSPPNIYVGGITYQLKIPQLLPGQTRQVYPSHYASGYSKMVSLTVANQIANGLFEEDVI